MSCQWSTVLIQGPKWPMRLMEILPSSNSKLFCHISNSDAAARDWTLFKSSHVVRKCTSVYISEHHCTSRHISAHLVHPSVPQCTSVNISAHQCTSVYISVHQCTAVNISAHQCTSRRISAHQCTSVHNKAHQCTSMHISANQCTDVHISVHQWTSVYISAQYTSVYVSAHQIVQRHIYSIIRGFIQGTSATNQYINPRSLSDICRKGLIKTLMMMMVMLFEQSL